MLLLSEIEDIRFEDLTEFYGVEDAKALDIPDVTDLSVFIDEPIEESEEDDEQ